MFWARLFLLLLLCGCVSDFVIPADFSYKVINAGDYSLATWQKDTNNFDPVHIYIEGDGHAFNSYGMPTNDPTPNGTLVRDLAMADGSPNVVYLARPCQFIMSDACSQVDWTGGRFSPQIIYSVAAAVKQIAAGRPVILIGYSGGAMVSGLVIQNNLDIDVRKWITIAGVLNHTDWTEYFGDSPLTESMDMTELPNVEQLHYIAAKDSVVPFALSEVWTKGRKKIIVPDALHNDLKGIELDFR